MKSGRGGRKSPLQRLCDCFRQRLNRNESSYSSPTRHKRCLVSTTDDFPKWPIDLTRISIPPQSKNRPFTTPVGKVGLIRARTRPLAVPAVELACTRERLGVRHRDDIVAGIHEMNDAGHP